MINSVDEIRKIKEAYVVLWQHIDTQARNAFDSLMRNDKSMAKDILAASNEIAAQETLVDNLCETFIAEYSPKNGNLRLVLTMLRISHNLKRIAYFSECIARFVLYQQSKPFAPELAKELQINKMIDVALKMISLIKGSLDDMNIAKANRVLGRDIVVDEIDRGVLDIITAYIQANPSNCKEYMSLMLAIRKIERICDKLSNIAKYMIKYIEAKENRVY